MQPTWQTANGSIRLYNADAREVLPSLDADLCLTDPPWGVANDNANHSRGRGNRPYEKATDARDFKPCKGDDKPFDPLPLLRFNNCIVWGANHFADKLPASSFWLAWDRKAGKAAASDITDCELAWTRGTNYRTVRMFRHMWAGFQRDSQAGERHLHPMEKPIALMKWCLGWFPKAKTIVDPYMGSCPVGIACINKGRSFIGIESDPAHYKTAEQRIIDELSRAPLFEKPPVIQRTLEACV